MQTVAERREDFLAPKQAARLLNVSVASIYRAVQAGSLPSVRLNEHGGAIRIPVGALAPKEAP